MLKWRTLPMLSILIALFVSSTPTQARRSNASARHDVRLVGGRFVVDGRPFLVRGIHYGPWRPGTGPNKGYPYPGREEIAADFDLIRQAGANTVLVYDPPDVLLDVAEEYGLKVVYVFALDWYAVGGSDQPALAARIASRAKQLREKPALLAYLLGNEVSGDALQSRGAAPIVAGLHDLYLAVKAADPEHPISHANWPPARHLNLGFFDFISFNVYPLWPPEVVAMGFGPYIETVLRPIAGRKPLLISEFGADTIEAGDAGQARLIRTSWDALRRAGAAGGVVFEFADEWWKNYNNPARPGDWWTRVAAPDDERRFDDDPEETYGIVHADRTPKPAYAAVREMFADRGEETAARTFGTVTLSSLVLVAGTAWVWARRQQGRRSARVTAAHR